VSEWIPHFVERQSGVTAIASYSSGVVTVVRALLATSDSSVAHVPMQFTVEVTPQGPQFVGGPCCLSSIRHAAELYCETPKGFGCWFPSTTSHSPHQSA
jgi:hypothetical protein